MSVSSRGVRLTAGRGADGTLGSAPARPYGRRVPLYIVPRTRAWLSEEEVAAAADCVPAVNDTLREDLRWIRSYVVSEEDGTFSAYCIYEATGPEVLRRHADALGLPTDAIKPVATTIVAAPDPEPAGTA
jgi:hypothetical protein